MVWKSIAISVAIALALFAGAVLYAVHRAPAPRGFSGLQFAALTPGAAARTPLLKRGGALIQQVLDDSPADKAKIEPGMVVAAINGTPITSARQASDMIRARAAGDQVILTLYDITRGEVHPRDVSLSFDAAPPVSKKFSVRPSRTLAKEVFGQPFPAAHPRQGDILSTAHGRQCVLVAAPAARPHHPPHGAERVGSRAVQCFCAGGLAGGGTCARQFAIPCDGG